MTHPTDEELDALVKRMENVSLQVGVPSRTILDSDVIRRAADSITALRAQLAASQPADPVTNAGCRQPVKVKPLVWVEIQQGRYYEARVIGILYSIRLGSDGVARWQAGHMGIWHEATTIEAAKAAAQADYEARVLAALEAAPHVNETPKNEHDGADVLTDLPAAQGRYDARADTVAEMIRQAEREACANVVTVCADAFAQVSEYPGVDTAGIRKSESMLRGIAAAISARGDA